MSFLHASAISGVAKTVFCGWRTTLAILGSGGVLNFKLVRLVGWLPVWRKQAVHCGLRQEPKNA